MRHSSIIFYFFLSKKAECLWIRCYFK